MLDANDTRHHLLYGEADWKRCQSAAAPGLDDSAWQPLSEYSATAIEWSAKNQAVRLRALPFRFSAPPLDEVPDLEHKRRGAAADRFGNWYWIDSSGLRLRVWRDGVAAADFWPVAAEEADAPAAGGFAPLENGAIRQPLQLAGITVTSEHFLVVGTRAPAGVLIFDLAGGGAPMHLLWPAGVPFVPFDMAAGPYGSTWILDRQHKACWMLDRRFNIVSFAADSHQASAPNGGAFAPLNAGGNAPVMAPQVRDIGSAVTLGNATDPISIEVLSDSTLLVLDRGTSTTGASICLYREGKPYPQQNTPENPNVLPLNIPVSGGVEEQAAMQPILAYDFTVVCNTDAVYPVDIFAVQQQGNQAYVFRLEQSAQVWKLNPLPGYRPMRRYGGRGIVTFNNQPYYDFAESWVPLLEEARPRHETRGALRTPVLDGKVPDCVWHRLMLDACIPSETSVTVYTRWANEIGLLQQAEWMSEPVPCLRRSGSEIPYLQASSKPAQGEGTWELLFQQARGQYLQIMLEFAGNQRATPYIQALRAYYPRFSYLAEYMPALYREDLQSAHFLEGFLANIEGFYTALEDRIANAQALFDQSTAPADVLDWLAGWFGAVLDPSWDEYRRRLFIRHAMLLFSYRGTAHGLRLALAMAFEAMPDEALFVAPGLLEENRFGVRIVEKYLARRLPDVLLGDPGQLLASTVLNPAQPWQRSEGRGVLNLRYALAIGLSEAESHGVELPLVAPKNDAAHPDIAEQWALFTEINLGFTPFAGALERGSWQAAVEASYITINDCNTAWRTSYGSFDEIAQPADLPQNAEQLDLWSRHMRELYPARTPLERLQWQNFLRSRYGAISALNAAYNRNWPAFDLVPFPDQLPQEGAALQDWLQFEGGVLAIRNAAHRFSVLLPMPTGPNVDPEETYRRSELARRIIALEKPAHTTFDVRFYWAMFRVGEARLGFDTQLEENMRELLIPSMVLGRGYIGAARVAPTFAESMHDRTVLGRDKIIQ